MKLERACGVLLHPSCLPGRFGIGDLGPAAYRYLEWLAAAGVSWWQVLPLNPPGPADSPYAATSSYAGNAVLLSPELLLQDGLLRSADLGDCPRFVDYWVDFAAVSAFKRELLRRAWARFRRAAGSPVELEFAVFREQSADWLPDFADYAALKQAHGGAPWWQWPAKLAAHDPAALASWRSENHDDVLFFEFCQLLFVHQWRRLCRHAHELGIKILGDVPIFVADDSADVWAHRELFQLDANGRPTVVAGVPPDYFSEDGQLWGNPLYKWSAHEETGYDWWISRLRAALSLIDSVRIDHFRGFAAHWEIPAGEQTARTGKWVPGPGRRLFDAAARALGDLPIVAEDLGVITPDVEALRDSLGFPGMVVLQFGFCPEPRSTFLPYNHRRKSVVYTGTHDNNTTLGWYQDDASTGERELLRRYVGHDLAEVHWEMIRLALASVADLAIIPHQDVAGLGADCRMNTPGTTVGNWRFRLTDWMLSGSLRDRLADLIHVYGRRRGRGPASRVRGPEEGTRPAAD